MVLGCDFAYFEVTNLPVIELRDEPLLLLPDLAMTPRSFLPRASGRSTLFDSSIILPKTCM